MKATYFVEITTSTATVTTKIETTATSASKTSYANYLNPPDKSPLAASTSPQWTV
jgi:hypothetical protein